MHLKHISKSNFLKHHSIPILLYRSIPLMCSLALLLLVSSLVVVDHNNNEVYAEEGIETYATTANPTATLQISNSSLKDVVSPGSTSYVSSDVNITAQDITDYTLIISGPTNLSGTTSITGAGGKTGDSLTDNTWGYAWTDPDTDDKGLTYSSLSENGSTLASGKATSLDISKKLTFAAKFAEDATSGHYKANVTLSLAATPREVATGFNGIYDMQDMTADICSSATIGQTGSLEDVRDGSIYTVGKLTDGNCWMTRNLRLVDYTTTEDDSQTRGFTIPNEAANFTGINNNAAYYPGDTDYGAYYSWYTATAGTGTAELTSGNASGSICPKGWRLPTGGSGGEYQALINGGVSDWATNGSKNGYWIGANGSGGGAFFSVTGSYNDDTLGDVVGGYYWSSTADDGGGAYRLRFNQSSAPFLYEGKVKYSGFAVRCVADDDRTLSDITKMQDMTPTICSNTSIGTTKTLTDSRDNSTYTVGKLSDGNCWMTQNLRIVNKTITPADSDVTGAFTIPASSTSGFSNYDIANAYYSNDASYGAYYSWYAVTAGTGAQSMSSGNAASSICPRGWRLPTGGSDGEFQILYNKWTPATWTTYNGKNGRWLGAPSASGGAFFPAAGYYDESSPRDIGSNGSYWSSTAYSNNSAFNPYFYSSTITFTDRSPKYLGFSARCIAR